MARIVDDYFIKSLDNISEWLKLPESVAGATLMAIGTSAPELSTALFALFLANTSPATGVGTIVGSAIFQILVVIGFSALVKTSYLNWRPVLRDGIFYAITVLLLVVFVNDGKFTFVESSLLLITYVGYLVLLYFWTKYVPEDNKEPNVIDIFTAGTSSKAWVRIRNFLTNGNGKKLNFDIFKVSSKNHSRIKDVMRVITMPVDMIIDLLPEPSKSKKTTIFIFVASLGSIAALSYILVLVAENMALRLGIAPAVVALTILAGGSSIPEMIGSAVVSKQGRGDMAISNAIGSNIFDILVSLGLPLFLYTALRGDLDTFGGENITSSIFLLFATMLMVLLLLAAQKFRVGKAFGLVLIMVYVLYVVAAYGGWL